LTLGLRYDSPPVGFHSANPCLISKVAHEGQSALDSFGRTDSKQTVRWLGSLPGNL
jgi:hypothetical protein